MKDSFYSKGPLKGQIWLSFCMLTCRDLGFFLLPLYIIGPPDLVCCFSKDSTGEIRRNRGRGGGLRRSRGAHRKSLEDRQPFGKSRMMNELARLRISFIENDRLRRRGRFTRRMTEQLFLEIPMPELCILIRPDHTFLLDIQAKKIQ